MDEHCLSLRQKGALCFTAGLSPALAIIPGQTATPWGFLTPVGLLAAESLALWALQRRRGRDAAGSLGETLSGRVVLGLLGVWCVVLLGSFAPLFARRISSAAYHGQGRLFFLLLLIITAGGLSLCRARTLGRLSELLFFPTAAGLLLVLPFAFERGDWSAALAAPDWSALGRGFLGSLPAALPLPVLAALFSPRKEDSGRGLWWGVALLQGSLAALLLAILVSFGPAGAAQLADPYVTLLKSLRLFGAVERAEALAISVLVYGDVLLLSGLVLLAGELLGRAAGRGRRQAWSLSAAAGGLALSFLPPLGETALLLGALGVCLLPLLPGKAPAPRKGRSM